MPLTVIIIIFNRFGSFFWSLNDWLKSHKAKELKVVSKSVKGKVKQTPKQKHPPHAH